jgi:RNA polymerase sigma-70 factor (ECF subfamily)
LQDDNALMQRVKDGDQQAFETLVLRHREAAVHQAARFVGDVSQAEDIVQECFADLYVHRSAYQPSFSFSTFLGALIRHKSIDALRKKSRFPQPVAQLPEEAGGETPESECIRHEIYNGLRHAIDDLPPEQRKMLLLFAIHGMDYGQIAKELNKSIPQVKVTLHRIRKKLIKAKEEWT